MGAMDILRQKAKKTVVAKKETTPVLNLPDTSENKEAMETFIEKKKVEKQAEADRKQAEAILKPAAETLKVEHCQSEGKYSTSIKVKVGDLGPLTYKTPNAYSKIGVDNEDALKVNSKELYDKLFLIYTEISLTPKGLKLIDTILPLLMEVAGKVSGGDPSKAFDEIFEVEQYIKPTDAYHELKTLDPKVKEIADQIEGDGLVKPYSSSFTL